MCTCRVHDPFSRNGQRCERRPMSALRRLIRRFLAVSEPVRQVNHRPRYYRLFR